MGYGPDLSMSCCNPASFAIPLEEVCSKDQINPFVYFTSAIPSVFGPCKEKALFSYKIASLLKGAGYAHTFFSSWYSLVKCNHVAMSLFFSVSSKAIDMADGALMIYQGYTHFREADREPLEAARKREIAKWEVLGGMGKLTVKALLLSSYFVISPAASALLLKVEAVVAALSLYEVWKMEKSTSSKENQLLFGLKVCEYTHASFAALCALALSHKKMVPGLELSERLLGMVSSCALLYHRHQELVRAAAKKESEKELSEKRLVLLEELGEFTVKGIMLSFILFSHFEKREFLLGLEAGVAAVSCYRIWQFT